MATIHMEVDSARNTAQTISTTKELLTDSLVTLDNRIINLVGSSWVSPAANEFQSSYLEWATEMREMVEKLAHLQQRLTREIDEFEQAASKLA
jgi:WXG100 family type VII secretion target